MKNRNDLDKELIKSDKMDMDVVRDVLAEMASEGITEPDFTRIRNALFVKKERTVLGRRYSRRVLIAFTVIAVMTLSACTVLAVRYIPVLYEWITEGNTSKIYTDQMTKFDTVEEAVAHIGIDLNIPADFPDGYSLKEVRVTDWGKFKDLTIQYVKNGETLTFTAVYEYANISDVKLIPYDIAAGANFEIDGIDIMYSYRDGKASSAWEIDGVPYLLWGDYTQDELTAIINSIK